MSSDITLSAATRQNLLSLQDTASLLSTTQNRLATGKKVTSALDSPVNFFTAQSLNSRSSGLSSLLDGISNSIQTIQAANQGITNITKLTDQLKSTANQALSASNAFTAKSALQSKALNGAVNTNLLSTGPTQALGGVLPNIAAATVVATTTGNVAFANDNAVLALTGTKTLTLNGTDITLDFDNSISDKAGLLSAINAQTATTGVTASYDGSNQLLLTGQANGQSFSVGGNASNVLGTTTSVAGKMTAANVTGSTKATDIGFTPGDSFTVNGASVSISSADTLDTLATKVVAATNGDVSAKFDATTDKFTFTAKDPKTTVNLGNGPSATGLVSQLGFSTTTQFAAGLGANGSVADLNNKVLSVMVGTGNSAKTVAVTFGSGTGQISTLDQLNDALAPADAQATIDSSGRLTITTTNDAGSQKLALGGNAVGTGNAFLTSSATATVGGDGQTARNKLVNDYNSLLTQIDQMAKDAGFNGVNLLNGDQMKVAFNADTSSFINVKGTATTSDSLGLNTITTADFVDNDSVSKVFAQITSASNTLRSQAASFSSNLSVVQNRQDFTKQIINVLDTGAANLTNADLNEEAANSQALSTRNSLGVSALSLANQAQQGILQLLR